MAAVMEVSGASRRMWVAGLSTCGEAAEIGSLRGGDAGTTLSGEYPSAELCTRRRLADVGSSVAARSVPLPLGEWTVMSPSACVLVAIGLGGSETSFMPARMRGTTCSVSCLWMPRATIVESSSSRLP